MSDRQSPLSRLWSRYRRGGTDAGKGIGSVFAQADAGQIAFIRSMMKEQRGSGILDVPLMELEYVLFDLETTGFHPDRGDVILSIGAIAVSGNRIREDETLYTLVKPGRSIPEVVQTLTGLQDGMFDQAPDLLEGLRRFLDFCKGRILIAHGTAHDKQFLNAALWRTTRTRLSHRVLDTMLIAKWLHPSLVPHDLDRLLHAYDIPVVDRHHALSDAQMTARLWCCFLQEMQTRHVMTLDDLYAHLSRR